MDGGPNTMSKNERRWDVYGGIDPRTIPIYGTPEAARYLRIPERTIQSWVFGRSYDTNRGSKQTPSLVPLARGSNNTLSFINLLELHVLGAIRRDHRVDMKRVRTALNYLKEKFGSEHPLVDEAMETDGKSLFVMKYGRLINASQDGQVAMAEILKDHLERIERDENGLAIRLYPFTRKETHGAPKLITIDPLVAFGRPVIVGSRATTVDVADRFKAGESPSSLAEDYGRTPEEIWEAIRCELETAA